LLVRWTGAIRLPIAENTKERVAARPWFPKDIISIEMDSKPPDGCLELVSCGSQGVTVAMTASHHAVAAGEFDLDGTSETAT
jgi:hypothetical protein